VAMQHFISSGYSYISKTTTEVVVTYICYLHLFYLSLGDPLLWRGIFQLPFCATVKVLFSYLCYIPYSNISIHV